MIYRLKQLIFRSQDFKSRALTLILFAIFLKFIGLLRSMLIAYYFGATSYTDAFLMALGIISIFIGVFSSGLYNVLIPFYYEINNNLSQYRLYRIIIYQIVAVFFILIGSIALFIEIESQTIIKVIAFGFDSQRIILTAHFLKYLLIYGYLNFFLTFFFALIQTKKNFFLPSLLGAIGGVSFIIVLISLYKKLGIRSLLVGQIVSVLLPLLILFMIYPSELLDFVRKISVIIRSIRNTFNLHISKFFSLYFPVVSSSSVRSLYQIVDRLVSSMLPVGMVSILYYAQLIYMIPYNFISIPISLAVFPDLTEYSTLKNIENMEKFFSKILGIILYIMLPIVIVILTSSEHMTNFILRYGKFGLKDALITSRVLKIYSIGLIPLSLNAVFQKFFFSRREVGIPTVIGVVSFFLMLWEIICWHCFGGYMG